MRRAYGPDAGKAGPQSADQQKLAQSSLGAYYKTVSPFNAVVNGTPTSTMMPNNVTTPMPMQIDTGSGPQSYEYTSDRGYYKPAAPAPVGAGAGLGAGPHGRSQPV
jgi:hypothetical protein